MNWQLPQLPPDKNVETINILKSLPSAHSALAELKGIASTMPNQNILINTLSIQEAKDSSAVENIITTHDDIYKSELNLDSFNSISAKEVQNYVVALRRGYELVKENRLLTTKTIIEIQGELEKNNAGIRKLPGTSIKNLTTGETVYVPPQNHTDIVNYLSNLEKFINDDSLSQYDPLVKLGIIHYQFESIHPFYDGNGRTGRIINILYLIIKELQTVPILYLSRYIIKHKSEYYSLLQKVREDSSWEEWLLFMIRGIEEISRETIQLILGIKNLMMDYKHKIRKEYKFYSQDLLNNLFKHPYTKIEFLVNDLGVTRLTAASYLNKLAEDGLLKKEKLGPGNYYINEPLFKLLSKENA